MASYTRLSSGAWRARVRRGNISESATFDTKREAQEWAASIEAAIGRRTYIGRFPERITLNEIAERYVKFGQSHYKNKSNKASWQSYLRTVLKTFGETVVTELDSASIARYRDRRIAGSTEQRSVTPATVSRELAMLSSLVRYAEQEMGSAGCKKSSARRPQAPAGSSARAAAFA